MYAEMVSVYIEIFFLELPAYLTLVSNSSHTISHIFQVFLGLLLGPIVVPIHVDSTQSVAPTPCRFLDSSGIVANRRFALNVGRSGNFYES